MRQRMFALGQDFYINNAAGQPCFKIDGKVRLIKESLKFRDMQGNLLYKLDEKVLRIREILRHLKAGWIAGCQSAQCHHRPAARALHDRDPGRENMMTMGKVIWAQYDILRSGRQVAKISKQFSWIGRDQYVVDVVQGEDDCLLLAVTVVIDMMVSNGR